MVELYPLQVLLVSLSVWVNRQRQEMVAYLIDSW